MAQTNAERQRAWRQRQAALRAESGAVSASVRNPGDRSIRGPDGRFVGSEPKATLQAVLASEWAQGVSRRTVERRLAKLVRERQQTTVTPRARHKVSASVRNDNGKAG